jgi:tRNA(Ser,Leu) C12 N-acetylase TAN1
MPEFYSDVTPREFVRECNKDEIQELINELVRLKKIKENHILLQGTDTYKDDEFNMCLIALSKNRITLTSNQENTIKSIGMKYLYL